MLLALVCAPGALCAADPPENDAFGDPLPEGALLRLGTTRGAPIGSFGIQKDGTVVSVTDTELGVAVRVWDIEAHSDAAPVLLPLAGKSYRGAAQVSANGKYVAGVAKSKLAVWEEATAKRVALFEIDRVSRFVFAPSGTLLAATTETDRDHTEAEIHFCDVATGKGRKAETAAGEDVESLAFSGDGKRFAVVSAYNLIVWDAATGKELWRADTQPTLAPHLDFSPDSKFVYTAGPKANEMTQRDATTGKPVRTFAASLPGGGKGEPKIDCARLSPGGKTLFTSVHDASRQKRAQIGWDTTTGKATSDRPFEARPLGEIEIAPNGQHFAPGFRGIFAFSAPKVDLLAGAERSLSAAAHTEFSNDGKWLVQVGSSGTGKEREYAATVVSTANWKVVCRVPTSAGGRADLSPDGTTLAVVTGDDVTFYDVATEKKFGGFRAAAGAWAGDRSRGVRVLRFTADGTKLITADIDTTALVWPVPARSEDDEIGVARFPVPPHRDTLAASRFTPRGAFPCAL